MSSPHPTLVATLLAALSLCAQACAGHTACCPPSAHGPGKPRALHVAGVGEVQVAPDVARTSLGVEARAQTAQAAADAVNAQMAKVLAALEAAGVARADMRTSNLSLHFEHHEPPRPPRPMEEGVEMQSAKPSGQYRASNTIEVTLRDLDRAPEAVAAATTAGANTMYGLNFELSDPAPHVKQARELAVRAAQADAAQLAELSGTKLGPVLAIHDGADATPMGGGGPMMAMRESVAVAPPMERGLLTVRHQVTLVVAIDE